MDPDLTQGRIRFNIYHPLTLSGEPNKFDVQNAATHEMGHWGGLDDLWAPAASEATMYYSIPQLYTPETKKRTLDADGIAGIRYVYGTP